jgi:hypothetical protein
MAKKDKSHPTIHRRKVCGSAGINDCFVVIMRLRRNKLQLMSTVAACLQMTGGWWGGMMTELFSRYI